MSTSFEYDLAYPGPAFPVAEITMTGRNDSVITQMALIDTGADATVIPLSVLRQIDARRLDSAFARNMDGSRYEIVLYSVKISVGQYPVYGIEAIANERTSEVVLGRDALNQLILTLNGLAQITDIEQ